MRHGLKGMALNYIGGSDSGVNFDKHPNAIKLRISIFPQLDQLVAVGWFDAATHYQGARNLNDIEFPSISIDYRVETLYVHFGNKCIPVQLSQAGDLKEGECLRVPKGKMILNPKEL